jgi:hypothetical protein
VDTARAAALRSRPPRRGRADQLFTPTQSATASRRPLLPLGVGGGCLLKTGLPWQQPGPPGRLTPARVRRGFRNIRQALPDLAGAPKPGKPGPGRPPGSTNRRPTEPPRLPGLRHYYEPVRRRMPRRYSAPPVSAVRRAPSCPRRLPAPRQCRHPPSHVPCRSRRPDSRRLHAGHRLASKRAPARLIPDPFNRSGSDVSCLFRHVVSGSLTVAFPVPT